MARRNVIKTTIDWTAQPVTEASFYADADVQMERLGVKTAGGLYVVDDDADGRVLAARLKALMVARGVTGKVSEHWCWHALGDVPSTPASCREAASAYTETVI